MNSNLTIRLSDTRVLIEASNSDDHGTPVGPYAIMELTEDQATVFAKFLMKAVIDLKKKRYRVFFERLLRWL